MNHKKSGQVFLTHEEVCELTEYRRKDKQRIELWRMGIKFKLSRTGRPLVLREELFKRFGLERTVDKESVEPDLDALRAISGG